MHAAAIGPAWRRWAKGLLAPGLVACAVAGGATLISGTGFGWLHTQGVAANIHTALSVTSDIGLGLGQLVRLLLDVDADSVKSAVQTLGLAVAIGLILVLARRAMRGAVAPAHALGLSLLLLVALSPMVQPWYLLWGMAVVAATGRYGHLSAVLIVLSAALVYETHPMGATPPYGFVLAGLAVLLGTFAIRRDPVVRPARSFPAHADPSTPRPTRASPPPRPSGHRPRGAPRRQLPRRPGGASATLGASCCLR